MTTSHSVLVLRDVDVFRFTFFWTLIFNSLFFIIAGCIASFSIIYPPRHDNNKEEGTTVTSLTRDDAPQSHALIPLTPLTSARLPDLLLPELSETVDTEEPRIPQPRKNVHRSRITYALLTLLTFLVTAFAASFIWSAVVGYVLWAVFQAGHFNVST